MAREVVAKLGWDSTAPKPALRGFAAPQYPVEELVGVVPADYRRPYDCREVIARVVDGSEFLEYKSEFDQQTICGRASIYGQPVGIISNNGPITTKGATKAAQFMQLCVQTQTPLVYLMNTTGYMVGTESEQGGIVKHGSKMVQAVANASVPRITIVMGGSFGAGNYGMCGRGFDPDFIFAWPNSRTAVMGGEQAAKVMTIINKAKAQAAGVEFSDEQAAKAESNLVGLFNKEADALAATARLFDDGLIDPRDTRRVLGFTLAICQDAKARDVAPNSFGVARL